MSRALSGSSLLGAVIISCCILKSEPRFSPRIVGGQNAASGFFPYQASIKDYKGNHICNGVIIKSSVVLTTAHCVDKTKPSSLSVLVGTIRLSQGGVSYPVKEVKLHERYNSFTLNNDIAILKLLNDIELTSQTRPIALGADVVGDNVPCVMSSWGFRQSSGSISDYLQYIFLNTINGRDCTKMLQTNIDESKLCTFTKANEGACYKDSGSPLVADGYLIGILSGGRGCAKGFPDVYTRISHFKNWISQYTSTY